MPAATGLQEPDVAHDLRGRRRRVAARERRPHVAQRNGNGPRGKIDDEERECHERQHDEK